MHIISPFRQRFFPLRKENYLFLKYISSKSLVFDPEFNSFVILLFFFPPSFLCRDVKTIPNWENKIQTNQRETIHKGTYIKLNQLYTHTHTHSLTHNSSRLFHVSSNRYHVDQEP